MVNTADIIMLGIVSGIRLAEQGRRAYAEATIERELVLPLPNFNPDVTVGVATNYFLGSKHVEENGWLKALYEKVAHGVPSEEEEKEFIVAYQEFKILDDVKNGVIKGSESALSREALVALVTVRQFARNRSPYPRAFQRVLGSLIEIGIDYFAHVPGALDEKSSSGRALKGFLKCIDDLDFAQSSAQEVARNLFFAALETIGETPSLLGADDKAEKLIEAVSRGLVKDLRERIEKVAATDLSKQEKFEMWGQLVLRSVLSNAGTTILSNPGTYLGVAGVDRQALASSVGTCVLDAILDEETIDLSRLYSRETLDRLVKTALVTISEYPGILGVDHKGLQRVLGQVAGDLSGAAKVLCPDILPEMMRLVLEKSALNMDLLWPEEFRKDPARHLMIIASRELLEKLSEPPAPGDWWTPSFSKTQLLEIAEVVLDEVVQNPDWLVKRAAGKNTILGDALEVALASLRKIPPGRISTETGVQVLKAAIKGVALRREFLNRMKFKDEEKEALGILLDMLVECLLSEQVDPKVRWVLARGEIFKRIAEASLERLAEIGVSQGNLLTLEKVLIQGAEDIRTGKPWKLESFMEELKTLSVVN